MKKAQREGITYTTVLKSATKAYIEGELKFGLVQDEVFNEKTRKRIEKALKDIKADRNLSPAFSNAEDAIAYLRRVR